MRSDGGDAPPGAGDAATLLDAAHQGQQLDGVLAELLSLRILEGGGDRAEALLVHLLVELDPHLLQRADRRGGELEGLATGRGQRVVGRLLDLLALALVQAVPR